MKKELFVLVVFLTVLTVACVPPPEPPYDGDCLIASVVITDDNETTGLVSYEIELAPTLKNEDVYMFGQKAPDDTWIVYFVYDGVIIINDWPKGESIEFSLYTGEIDDPLWFDPTCSEYEFENHLMIYLE